jgi:hypothetical protein
VGLPDVMAAGVEQYTQYFDDTTHKTRRLTWQVGSHALTPLGTGVLYKAGL